MGAPKHFVIPIRNSIWATGSWLTGQLTGQFLCVCAHTHVCMLLWRCLNDRKRRRKYLSFWTIDLCLTNPPGKLILAVVLAAAVFNCLAQLISSSLTMNGGGSHLPVLLLPLSLTNSQSGSQASRLSEGEQSDWVMSQTSVVWSHGLMLCQTPQSLAHSTRFLSQQRNTLTTWGFYTFAVPLTPPSPISVYFSLSNLLLSSLFFHLALSVYFLSLCICKLFLFPCYSNVTKVKGGCLQSSHSSSGHPFS